MQDHRDPKRRPEHERAESEQWSSLAREVWAGRKEDDVRSDEEIGDRLHVSGRARTNTEPRSADAVARSHVPGRTATQKDKRTVIKTWIWTSKWVTLRTPKRRQRANRETRQSMGRRTRRLLRVAHGHTRARTHKRGSRKSDSTLAGPEENKENTRIRARKVWKHGSEEHRDT